jgi:hypothetical protein
MAQSIESKTQLWNKRLRQFENSSLTVAEFCQSIVGSRRNEQQDHVNKTPSRRLPKC